MYRFAHRFAQIVPTVTGTHENPRFFLCRFSSNYVKKKKKKKNTRHDFTGK